MRQEKKMRWEVRTAVTHEEESKNKQIKNYLRSHFLLKLRGIVSDNRAMHHSSLAPQWRTNRTNTSTSSSFLCPGFSKKRDHPQKGRKEEKKREIRISIHLKGSSQNKESEKAWSRETFLLHELLLDSLPLPFPVSSLRVDAWQLQRRINIQGNRKWGHQIKKAKAWRKWRGVEKRVIF